MWLLPTLSRLSALAAHGFYRLTISGERVPAEGPVLLVANHPNSLVDPVFVACAAERPVRFLAKAPLFHHPLVGFLVRGSGSIPVYRRKDDPSQMTRNEDTFRAAYDALVDGSAVALFPEGVSHTEPALQPLKTGAARIALGARRVGAPPFPIVPLGIVLRARETFRSEALIVIGEPLAWDDLGHLGEDDREAVQSLTERIDAALHGVTVNLERWEDAPLVETAAAVWAAETGADPAEEARIARLERTASVLAALRAADESAPRWRPLARRLHAYRRKLDLLDLTPATLSTDVSSRAAFRWGWRRLPLLLAAGATLVGSVLFWPPYRLVGLVDRRRRLDPDVRATHKLLGGIVIMGVWIVLLAMLGALWRGPGLALLLLVGLPILGLFTLWLRDVFGDSWRQARRYLLLRYRPQLRSDLLQEQARLAEELDRLNQEFPAP